MKRFRGLSALLEQKKQIDGYLEQIDNYSESEGKTERKFIEDVVHVCL